MRKLSRLAIVLAALLASLGGCHLYQAINLTWDIIRVTYANPVTSVTYTATNLGKVDLTGVNLEVGVDVDGNGTYPLSVWTPDFSISTGETVSGTVAIRTGVLPLGGATVLSVDMDNPKD